MLISAHSGNVYSLTILKIQQPGRQGFCNIQRRSVQNVLDEPPLAEKRPLVLKGTGGCAHASHGPGLVPFGSDDTGTLRAIQHGVA